MPFSHVFPALALLACALALPASALGETPERRGTDEIRAIVAEMLADAETRSSLMTGGSVSAGAGGFKIADDSGGFSLRVGGYAQFRYLANFRDEDDPAVDDFQSGFTLQRTRLIFAGRAHDRVDFLLLPFSGPNGVWSVLDAWSRFELAEGVKLRVGQFKLPFWREWLVSERFNFGVERTELTAVFASIYGQGVQFEWEPTADLRLHASFSDGVRTLNTDFDSRAEADYAFTARLEWLASGAWSMFADHTSLGQTESGLLVGAAAHYQGETEAFRGVEVDRLVQFTADVSYQGNGWSAMAAGVGRWLDAGDAPTERAFGVLAQAGVFLTERTELIAVYELLIPDEDAAGDDSFNAITLGVNHYFAGHALKLTVDAIWFIDETEGTTIIGFGQDNATGLFPTGDSGEVSLRAQIQFVF